MKFKPTDKAGEMVVELGPRETQLPAQEERGTLPVFKLKKVLVPVDFSGCSEKALAYALPLAEQFEAELVLLHVMWPYVAVPEMGPVDVETIDDARKALESLGRSIHEPVRYHTVLRTGLPHVEIIQAAKELGIDLIILSTHGRTGLARAVMGSTAEKVVRHAGCPVLVVREHEHEFLAEVPAGAEGAAA
jgi:universal stress protein A